MRMGKLYIRNRADLGALSPLSFRHPISEPQQVRQSVNNQPKKGLDKYQNLLILELF